MYNIEYWNQSCVQWNSVLKNELCKDKQDNCVWTQNYSDKRRWCSGIMQYLFYHFFIYVILFNLYNVTFTYSTDSIQASFWGNVTVITISADLTYCVTILKFHYLFQQWIVPQLSIRINYNGTWSILIQWPIGLW